MAEIQTSTWSETAASNNASPPDGFPEGMAYSAVNDGVREQMAALKRGWNRDHATLTSGGTSTAYTLTLSNSPAAWVQGLRFAWRANADCGDAPTLAPGSLAAKALQKPSTSGLAALAANDIRAGQLVFCTYDTTADALIVENVIAGLVPIPPTPAPALPPFLLADATALSGSSTQVTGIPSTAKYVEILVDRIATNGAAPPMIQIGPSGGAVTTGYVGAITALTNGSSAITSLYSSGFTLAPWSSAVVASGAVRLKRASTASNIWVEDHSLGRHDGGFVTVSLGAGSIALSGALERVRVITTDTLTAGTMTVFYS